MGLMSRKRQLGGNFLAWTDGTHRRSGCKRGSLREKDALIGALIMKKKWLRYEQSELSYLFRILL